MTYRSTEALFTMEVFQIWRWKGAASVKATLPQLCCYDWNCHSGHRMTDKPSSATAMQLAASCYYSSCRWKFVWQMRAIAHIAASFLARDSRCNCVDTTAHYAYWKLLHKCKASSNVRAFRGFLCKELITSTQGQVSSSGAPQQV
eukprot:5939653-Amphidinium_carterae.1